MPPKRGAVAGRARRSATPRRSRRGILIPLRLRGLQLRLELLFQDLAGRALGERVDELDRARVLVSGDALLDERDDVGFSGRGARLQRHDRLHLLAKAFVGYADYCSFAYGRVGVEHLFNLARVDVEAAADDHLLLPVDDEVVT